MGNHQEQQQQQQQQQQQEDQDQEPMVSMDLQKNPNSETTHHHHVLPLPSSSSQDFKHQHNIHSSKKTHEDEGFIFKNPNSLSCPSLMGREEYMPPPPPPSPQDIKKAHHGHHIHMSNKTNIGKEGFAFKNPNSDMIKKSNLVSCSLRATGKGHMTTPPPSVPTVEESGRDRLKRHRVEMAGRVWIPDTWGHEDFLKDWIDCTVFDSSLGNNTIMSARAALMQEGRSKVRIGNKC